MVTSPVIQQRYKMKDIWRIHALNDYFLQYLNFVILSILVRNAAQQKCESEGNKRGRHKECYINLYTSKPERVLSRGFLYKSSYNQSFGALCHPARLRKHARHHIIYKETLCVVDNEWFQVIFDATQSLLMYLKHIQFRGGVYLCI